MHSLQRSMTSFTLCTLILKAIGKVSSNLTAAAMWMTTETWNVSSQNWTASEEDENILLSLKVACLRAKCQDLARRRRLRCRRLFLCSLAVAPTERRKPDEEVKGLTLESWPVFTSNAHPWCQQLFHPFLDLGVLLGTDQDVHPSQLWTTSQQLLYQHFAHEPRAPLKSRRSTTRDTNAEAQNPPVMKTFWPLKKFRICDSPELWSPIVYSGLPENGEKKWNVQRAVMCINRLNCRRAYEFAGWCILNYPKRWQVNVKMDGMHKNAFLTNAVHCGKRARAKWLEGFRGHRRA